MRMYAAAACALAAVALSACGGSSTKTTVSKGQRTPTSSTPSVITTVSVPATISVPHTTPSTTTGANGPGSAAPRCRSAGMALSFLGQQGATGHGEIGFALRNITGRSCHTFGYPGVLFLTQGGQPLTTISTRTTHDYFGVAPVSTLVVAPGASVSFRLGVTHGISSSAGCTTAYGLQVIAPDDTATLRVGIPGGAYECQTATVSPLRPGSSAYP